MIYCPTEPGSLILKPAVLSLVKLDLGAEVGMLNPLLGLGEQLFYPIILIPFSPNLMLSGIRTGLDDTLFDSMLLIPLNPEH